MGVMIRCRDWLPGGPVSTGYDLELPTRRASVRELMERRVARELEMRALEQGSTDPVSPKETAQAFKAALKAFKGGQLVVLSPQKQFGDLNDIVELAAGEELTFLQLRPLASG